MAVWQNKYETLLTILDAIREEARGTKWHQQYACGSSITEEIQQARSKAFIHLYLKVMFGIVDFAGREAFVTDGANDGGVDGYFIDADARRIYLLQSKFRNTADNFENKKIDIGELLVMDIDLITGGSETNEKGEEYNGKIKGLIRRISEIPDVARYSYEVCIIANCDLPPDQLRRLTTGHRASVFNHERAYNELVFPIVSGTFFKAHDVTIKLDLTNKSAGAKTSYSVETSEYECEITVLFLPTLEIAKAMDKFRNSILEYNPRSYLDLEGQFVNSAIRATLLRSGSNEFALMNNGLTILSDETNLNERIGQQNKAQLRLLNPQIINGGQTAYTLSRIYNEDREGAEEKFAGKEVLSRIITLTPKDPGKNTSAERMKLIDEISEASNRQTPVIRADKASNEEVYKYIQKALFEKHGILFERKRGEFSDGVVSGYIEQTDILERNFFVRLVFASKGKLKDAAKKRIFLTHGLPAEELKNDRTLEVVADAWRFFVAMKLRNPNQRNVRQGQVLAKIYLALSKTDNTQPISERMDAVNTLWKELRAQVGARLGFTITRMSKSGKKREVGLDDYWQRSNRFQPDVTTFVETGEIDRRSDIVISEKDREEFLNLVDDFPPTENRTEE